jgi:hypothetical protein
VYTSTEMIFMNGQNRFLGQLKKTTTMPLIVKIGSL